VSPHQNLVGHFSNLPLNLSIEEKFSDMIQRYRIKKSEEKFTKFMLDYFKSRGSEVKITLLEY